LNIWNGEYRVKLVMRAARNERHIMSGRGYPPAKVTSHGTGSHDRDPHVTPSARLR